MTENEIRDLKINLILTAEYFNHRIPDHVLKMYAEDLKDLDFSRTVAALNALRRDPETRFFPLPAVIRKKVLNRGSSKDEARLIVGEIWNAIARFGWPNAELAKKNLSPVAWRVVEKNGGWNSLCVESGEADAGVFKSHLREYAEVLLKKFDQGPFIENQNYLEAIDEP